MFFGLFGKSKSAGLKLKQRQEIEIEFLEEDTGYETHFTQVLDVQSKKVIVKSPGTEHRPIRMIPGQKLTVTVIDEGKIFTFDSVVIDAGEREFDIAPPANVKDEPLPSYDEENQLEVSIKVEYRAMKTAHNQMANTYSVANGGLKLTTNLPVPPGTQLHLDIEIPGAPEFSISAHAVGSRTHPTAKGKHLCEVEYENIPEDDSKAIIRYAIYAKKRLERQALREQQGQ